MIIVRAAESTERGAGRAHDLCGIFSSARDRHGGVWQDSSRRPEPASLTYPLAPGAVGRG